MVSGSSIRNDAIIEVGYKAFHVKNGNPTVIEPLLKQTLSEGPLSSASFISKFNKFAGAKVLITCEMAEKYHIKQTETIDSFCDGCVPGQRAVEHSRYHAPNKPAWIYTVYLQDRYYRVDNNYNRISYNNGKDSSATVSLSATVASKKAASIASKKSKCRK